MKKRASKLSGLALLLFLNSGCSTNTTIPEETRKILEQSKRIVEKDYLVTTEEIPVYERGPREFYMSDFVLSLYPIGNREGVQIPDFAAKAFPPYTFSFDSQTNQILTRLPRDKEKDNSYLELKTLYDFFESVDISPAQYRIHTHSVRVTAGSLNAVRSSLNLLLETGDISLALDSKVITERAKAGIEHTINIIPFSDAQISFLLDGLSSMGYVQDLSVTTLNALNGDTAQSIAKRRVPIDKVVIQGQATFLTQEYVDVERGLTVTPIGQKNQNVMLKVETKESELVPSGKDLPIINTRTITTKNVLKLGQTVIIGSVLDTRARGEREESPFFGGLVSARERESSRSETITFLTPYRIDTGKQSNSNAVEKLEKELDR